MKTTSILPDTHFKVKTSQSTFNTALLLCLCYLAPSKRPGHVRALREFHLAHFALNGAKWKKMREKEKGANSRKCANS